MKKFIYSLSIYVLAIWIFSPTLALSQAPVQKSISYDPVNLSEPVERIDIYITIKPLLKRLVCQSVERAIARITMVSLKKSIFLALAP